MVITLLAVHRNNAVAKTFLKTCIVSVCFFDHTDMLKGIVKSIMVMVSLTTIFSLYYTGRIRLTPDKRGPESKEVAAGG